MLSITLTDQVKILIKKLDNKLTEFHSEIKLIEQEELDAIKRYAKISTLGASTRIENAQLTNPEIEWIDTILTADGHVSAFQKNKSLINKKLSKDKERSIEEVAGCREMLLLITDNADEMSPLTETNLRSLHHALMKPYFKDSPYSGNYKIQSNSVVETNKATGDAREVFKTADAGVVTKMAMQALVEWYNQSIPTELFSFGVVCEFVYRFLAIHPFQDGNGRLGRGIFLLGLTHSNNIALQNLATYCSLDRQIERHKQEYYTVLNACSDGKFSEDPKNYHMEYFLKFMLKMAVSAIDDIAIYREKYKASNQLSESATKILNLFKEYPEIKLTTQKIEEITRLARRTISYSLNLLTEKKLIQKYGSASTTRYQITF